MAGHKEPLEYELGSPFPGVVGRTADQSTPAWLVPPRPPAGAPNVVLLVLDDVGYAQLSPFGGACEMPTLDGLAENGLRYTSFHATALCSPTRACLLTGRNHHNVGMSSLSELALGFPGHHSTIGPEHAFLPAALRQAGYNTFAVGKWHLASPNEWSGAGPFRTWPLGRGFERFYGFISGDTDQWYPDLVQDNAVIDPPYAPEDGYHLNRDLADHAIQFVKDARVANPDKPFFLYYATGAGHAPHHVETDWIARYKGRFDAGWDAYREDALAAQKRLGIQPEHVELSDRDPDVVAWESLSDDAKRMCARQMETFAGFLSQTDYHFGRVLDFIDELGELENTIVIAISDNGASAEGGPEGTFNEALFFNLVPERLEDNLDRFEEWGGVETFPHYAWGWTWAGNAPFRRWKRETYRGGVSLPCIVSWPARLGAQAGGVRTQYTHVIDVAATILDATGVGEAAKVDGVEQEPLDGVSLVSTFDDPAAPEVRSTQYFEMNGHRSIYHDGWRAVSPFEAPSLAEAQERGRPFRFTPLNAAMLAELDTEWELYNVAEDPAERLNLASQEPERLKEIVERWYEEAEKYKVFPVAGYAERIAAQLFSGRPERDRFTFYPGASPLPFTLTPRLAGRAHAITADVDIPDESADSVEGILLAQGNRRVGFAFYLLDGRLRHVHNYVGLEWFTVSSPEPIPPGRHELRYEFEPTGPAVDLFNGKGVPGRSKLYVDGELVAAAALPYTVAVLLGFYGMTCGYDTAGAVDPSAWNGRFDCTAQIHRVVLDVEPTITSDEEALVQALIAQQ
ncbi:MAG: arylsulfatase [Acidobacteria bacterium]|nr:MAG: arylsulfatase [Acidobacteriota bacterium]